MFNRILACAVVSAVVCWRSLCPWAKRNVIQRFPGRKRSTASTEGQSNKIGVVLINLGTPTAPTPWFVRKFLVEFLTDYRVIDSLPGALRTALVYLIISPIRCFTSGISYAKLWKRHHDSSPLLTYSQKVCEMVQERLGSAYIVKHGMRYQEPSLASAMNALCEVKCSGLIILPMFPQYASSSSGSAMEWAMRSIGQWEIVPNLHFISHFFAHPQYVTAMARSLSPEISGVDILSFDHVLFSYHGLPWRHVANVCDHCKKVDVSESPFPLTYSQNMKNRESHMCMHCVDDSNAYCYRAHCYATTRRIAEAVGLKAHQHDVVFQSRFGKDPWLQPYADDIIRALPSRGKKRVAIVGPSFVTDCLETTCELGEEYKEIFIEEGGVEWFLFPALNDSVHWAQAIADMVQEKARLM
ncbi:ferrochelatase [Perkinsela sp. CCAP 1560/4]|nr:ferrochelatase [Perkinsela sp. CCAP 1560/4]|eukprot:KNH01727.1 ferrochelatase [Perkinsela sp. CCAP 1560/4]